MISINDRILNYLIAKGAEGCGKIPTQCEYLKLIVAALTFAAAEARLLGREETLRLTAAALASARRDLALYKANGYERAH